MVGRSLRDRMKSSTTREEPAEVAWASVSDAPRTPSSGGVPGMPHREETLRKTQDTLE